MILDDTPKRLGIFFFYDGDGVVGPWGPGGVVELFHVKLNRQDSHAAGLDYSRPSGL